MPSLLACASPSVEQDPTSKYFCCLGLQASMSQLLTLRSAKSPLQHSKVLTGISKLLNKSTEKINQRQESRSARKRGNQA